MVCVEIILLYSSSFKPPSPPLTQSTHPPPLHRIQRVMDSFPETYWRIKLAVLLVAERMKGPQSFWWPYLRNLPEKYAHMPIFYNNSEFGSIQIPSLMRTVQSRCRMLVNISDGYLRQLSHAGPAENPFLDDVHANDMGWGLCAASSRALRQIPGLGSTPLMVPLIDLCQHATEPTCYIKDYRVRLSSLFFSPTPLPTYDV